MCGRYNVIPNAQSWLDLFGLTERFGPAIDSMTPRYNVAPTQVAAVIRAGACGRELAELRWGLIPHWTRPALRPRYFINARAETAARLPAFRVAFRRRPCLVPASGWYEWRKLPGGLKQPYCIVAAAADPMAFAGLWESWDGADGAVETFTILTRDAQAALREIHPRMPLVLRPDDYAGWLEGTPADRARIAAAGADEGGYRAWPVSILVNNPRNDSPACIERPGPDR